MIWCKFNGQINCHGYIYTQPINIQQKHTNAHIYVGMIHLQVFKSCKWNHKIQENNEKTRDLVIFSSMMIMYNSCIIQWY